ncbi:MAG: DNA gyrase subunit A [Muribaculaceae bacterium]|nr:DNA gyrase subunit A [Muribaculaceae bacterium]
MLEEEAEDKIFKIKIEEEMKSAYIDYSMSVIVSRALPDVRDGMKPVHRRVLFGMNEMGNTSNKPHKKAANCVGEVMGKYHPHGDSSIYGTVVRMAQDWSLRNTLVDGHGNFGSIDGDSPAAMRYTEVRLSKIGEEMLRDIDAETVDFQPNYDNSRREPVVLPTRFPNLLVNGASGIAVGMATNMPTHNLTESLNASIALIDDPEMSIPDLMKVITAPDFPTGGIIYGYQGVKEAYETGRGRIVIRAKATIEDTGTHENIIVHEIPYGVNKAELVKSIAQLVNEKKIDGIADINDESDYKGMRIVIKVKTDANAKVLLNKLFKMTQLESSFSVNNVALVHGRPRTLNLKELLQAFIDHRHDVVIRRTQFELRKARERAHILEGLMIAVQNIDEVIQIIRSSSTPDEARTRLAERFDLSDAQTQAIVDMRLRSLTALQIEELRKDLDEIHARIAELELILNDDHVCRELIKTELAEIRDKYGDERRTEIDFAGGDRSALDYVSDDDMIITISHMGYIKRTPLAEFRAQNRGGMGSRGSQTRDEDFIEHIYTASMHEQMLFFTDRGLVYKMYVYELPEGSKSSKGRALPNLLSIDQGDSVNAYIRCRNLGDADYCASHYLVFATRNGIIKKTALTEYARVLSKGKKAIIIREGDSLVGVELTDGNCEILMANRNGRAIRFHESKLRSMGRVSAGVRGMRLDEDGMDQVVGLITMPADTENSVLVLSEEGFGKRSPLDAYRLTNRGAKGVKTMNITEKTGHLVAFKSVNDENDLVIINQSGMTIRIHVASIRVMGRATQGVRLINIGKRNDVIASVCCVAADPEEEVEEVLDAEELPGLSEAELEADETTIDDEDEPEAAEEEQENE